MSIVKFLHSVIPGSSLKSLITDVLGSLDDLPSLQKKMDVFFMGTELLLYLQEDNDLSDFLAGRIVISQSTLVRFLNRLLEKVPGVESVSVEVREGYMICIVDTDKGPGGLQVTVKLGNLQLFLKHKTPCLQVDILEFPDVRLRASLAAFFCCSCMYFLKRIVSTERIYRRVVRDVPGLTVKGNTFILDLMQVPGLEDKLSRELFGIRLLEVFDINRIEFKDGKVQIYGGPRIPEKLIQRNKVVP